MQFLTLLLFMYSLNALANLEGTVVRVKDGDTFVLSANGIFHDVRLIGVDTPESVHPSKSVECFGKEASNFLKNYLTGKTVKLEEDPSQSTYDKYRRRLGYVWIEKELVNLKIIREGYGHEYTYNIPYKYQSEFKKAQEEAELEKKGLWAPTACANVKKESIVENNSGIVKRSRAGICHKPGSRYYLKTKHFTSFKSIGECLKTGRLPN